jgi:L-alanine-DL-glutamate epimerase-like enolase superfamily enzyme
MKSGLSGAMEIIAMCRKAGVTLMLGCMLESHIGIGAAVHLACGTGAFDYLDLDAPLLLKEDIAHGSFTLRRDVLTPGESPGLGAVLDAGG